MAARSACLVAGPFSPISHAARHLASGRWQCGAMTGYTNRGIGVAGPPLRFNCSGEAARITLRRSTPA